MAEISILALLDGIRQGLLQNEAGAIMNNVIPLKRSEHVTITKRQYRQACNAYINSVNAQQQLLMVHRGDNPFSDAAVGRLEDAFQVIIQQLKEIVDGENDVPS